MTFLKNPVHSPRFVRGGANLISFSLALALGLAQTAFAGPLPVNKDKSTFSSQSQQNFATLRARALAEGTVRIDIMLTLPDKNALRMMSDISQREQSLAAEVAAFELRYAGLFQGALRSASLTPMLHGAFTASGLDQLLLDSQVNYFSYYGASQPMLRQVNQVMVSSGVPMSSISDQTIAIVDSGVDISHPEFGNRVVAGACFSTASGTFVIGGGALPSLCSTTGNGPPSKGAPCASTNSLFNAALQNCGHGTHVAGIAASSSTTDPNLSGLAPSARIVSVQTKSLANNPNFATEPNVPYISEHKDIDIVSALNWVHTNAIENNRKLAAVNMSFGYVPLPSESWDLGICLAHTPGLYPAVFPLTNIGVAVVASAGNLRTGGNDFGLSTPACELGVIAVAATNKQSQAMPYSNFGFAERLADFVAPGGANVAVGFQTTPNPCTDSTDSNTPICASKRGGSRELRSGTSMSAPAVAGAIARIRHRFPNITGMQAAALLKASGQPVSSLWVSANIPQPNLESAFRQATLPQGIMASTATCGQINLSWTAPSIMVATEYRVRFASTAAGLEAATQTPTIQAVTNFSISATQPQFFQVIAKDVTDDGVWSTVGSAVPNSCVLNAVTNSRVYPAPTNPNCINGIQWDANVGHSGDYEVQEACATVTGSIKTGTIRTVGLNLLPFGTPYCATNGSQATGSANTFKVRACQGLTCSAWSAPVYGGTIDRCVP